jgi:hypothetical protein
VSVAGRAGGVYNARARRSASVIVIQLTRTMRLPPPRTILDSKVACLLRTKSCSVPIPNPCANMSDSVLPVGEPASNHSASRWSAGRAIPAT